jgi:hypothetical protein
MGHKTSPSRAKFYRQPIEGLAPAIGDVVVSGGLPRKALRPIEGQALVVAARNAEKFRKAVKPVEAEPVDFTVRITGTLDVDENQSATITKWPKGWEVLAVVFSVVDDPSRITRALAKSFTSGALNDGVEIPKHHKGLAIGAYDRIVGHEQQIRSGNVSGVLQVEVLKREKLKRPRRKKTKQV